MKPFLLTAPLLALTLVGCNPDPTAQENNAQTDPVAAQSQSPAEPEYTQPTCANCGTIAAITPVSVKGESSGAGAAIGAVAGGLLGRQVGGGSGKDIATVVGAVGGAVAGNEVEKRRNATTYYAVTVNLDNGGQQVVNVNSTAGISVGMAVEVVGNDLHLR